MVRCELLGELVASKSDIRLDLQTVENDIMELLYTDKTYDDDDFKTRGVTHVDPYSFHDD